MEEGGVVMVGIAGTVALDDGIRLDEAGGTGKATEVGGAATWVTGSAVEIEEAGGFTGEDNCNSGSLKHMTSCLFLLAANTWKKSSEPSSSDPDSFMLLTICMIWDSDTFSMQAGSIRLSQLVRMCGGVLCMKATCWAGAGVTGV